MPSFVNRLGLSVWLFALPLFVACQPVIGDACESSIKCSVTGDRVCDLAQPEGYCSIQGCDPDTCPDDALCVEWRFEPNRTATSWCMLQCDSDSDCRDGYACVDSVDPRLADEQTQMSIARVTDLGEGRPTAKFCAAFSAL